MLSSPPVADLTDGKSASIGGANIARVPAAAGAAGQPAGHDARRRPAPAGPPAPVASLPAKVTTKALGAGLPLKLTVAAAGKVTISATVPAKAVGRKGKPVVVATGTGVAKAAGKRHDQAAAELRRPQEAQAP